MAEVFFDPTVKANYIRFGCGPRAMIVIPGIYLNRLVPLADALENQCREFKNDFTVYVVERRNVLDNSVSVEDMAEDTAEIMKNCGITKAYLYGVSQGGVMVQLIAAKHPELVEKAVIVSSTSRINDMVRNVMSSFIEKLHAGQLQALGEDFAEKLYAPETIKQFPSLKTIDPNIPEINLKNFEIMARDCMYGETDAILDRIKCPVLVIGGKLDRVYGEEEDIYIAERLNCRYISYEKFGHAVYDECPEVLKEVYQFFISSV